MQWHGSRTVGFVQILQDVVGFVHLNAGVGIDEIRELGFAPAFDQFRSESFAAFRTGSEIDDQAEVCDPLTDFATVRAAFKLIQDERLLGLLGAFAADSTAAESQQRCQN